MSRLRRTLSLCCVAMFAGMAVGQEPVDQLGGAADEAALIGLHQELNIPRGDTDANGRVSFADFLNLAGNYGQSGTSYRFGDLNLDGETSMADFSLLSQNFGMEGYQPEPASRPPNANLGLSLSDGELIVSSATAQQIGGVEIRSSNGSLVTGATESAEPFTFYLSRENPNLLSWGTLGNAVEFDGDFHTDYGTTDSSSLTVSWFEPGSYDLYTLGFGEGDALTNRRLNDPQPPPANDPPPVPRPPLMPFDERFNEVANLSELVDLHQEADVPRGDLDTGGDVSFADFLTMSRNYKTAVDNYSDGDANLDGIVDLKDFAILSNNFGQSGYSPDPPPVDRVQITASIDADQRVVISAAESVDLGGLVIESGNAGLNGDIPFDVSAEPFTFFLERTNESVTLASLGTFVSFASVDEPFTTNVTTTRADAEVSLQWFQRGSYEVFSTADGAPAPLTATLVGDIDRDGRVAFPDFLILSRSYGQEVAAKTNGDIDGDGNVAFKDFLMLSNNFGAVAASPVPEPSTHCMLAAAGIASLCIRRRRRQT